MMSFIKSSPLAFVAYQVSSVITLFQMSLAQVTMPETYEWVMAGLAKVTVPTWDLACQLGGVIWEFLNSSI